jgi:hypothetical protein
LLRSKNLGTLLNFSLKALVALLEFEIAAASPFPVLRSITGSAFSNFVEPSK